MCLYGGGFDCKIGKQKGLFGGVTAAGKGRGKRKREPRGYRCPPWLGLWRCGEGSCAVAGARGGGDGGWWCSEVGKAVVERRGGAGGSFIGALGRWSGAGWVVAGGAAGERCGAE